MQYQVFVQADVNQSVNQPRFVASVLGMPNLSMEGATEAEAMANAKVALEETLAAGKLVTIEVDSPIQHPLPGAGLLADDPTFDDWMEKLAEIRRVENVTEVAE